MADLKQALKWLIEGKKVKHSDWKNIQYTYLKDCRLYREDHTEYHVILCYAEGWELYEEPRPIPPPQYDSREVLNNDLIDMEDYIVWDRMGNCALAVWSADNNCFYPLIVGFCFALDVVEWKQLPKQNNNNKITI